MTQPREREIYNSEVRRDNTIIRENNAGASGLTLGILLASLAALAVGTFFYLNQQSAPQSPNQTTIIEKTKEAAPVPQQQAPDVNITVPSPEPIKMPEVKVNVPNPASANQTPAAEPNAAKP